MTDQQHPITPPPELVQQWANESPMECSAESWAYELFIAHHAAQWGADQELEACCSIALTALCCGTKHQRRQLVYRIRAARRPKPPSLKEQALAVLDNCANRLDGAHENTIRRALEALPND
jgi:hypothetical protein